MSTTALFNHIDVTAQPASLKSWTKVDGGGHSFTYKSASRPVYDLRNQSLSQFTTDTTGFGLQHWPSPEKDFVDDAAVRGAYYADVEALLRENCEALPSNQSETGINRVHKIVIFDHTIRRRVVDAPRGPVQQVHVDQTPAAVVARVRRHLPPDEVDDLLKHRFQLINVWRPIGHPASDHPLAVIDWRSTVPDDFIPVDLLYPKRTDSIMDDDDRGKEKPPQKTGDQHSAEGYEVRGETMSVAANENHRFYYVKDMAPDEAILLKCYDSWGDGEPAGKAHIAVRTPHTAFEDPATPADAKPRESIEIRALTLYLCFGDMCSRDIPGIALYSGSLNLSIVLVRHDRDEAAHEWAWSRNELISRAAQTYIFLMDSESQRLDFSRRHGKYGYRPSGIYTTYQGTWRSAS
ncbi:hypothetical protein GGS21DRAFT_548714 [Xylaria nigripes]|nr:hypothetical protein GGS21DRAFT_548714 [Xylaria nigripes]